MKTVKYQNQYELSIEDEKIIIPIPDLNDVEFEDGSKLYETFYFGKILIKDPKLVKMIDEYCEDPSSGLLFEELKNYPYETFYDVLKILD